MLRAAYLLSHPIQYQSPLLRRLAAEPGLDLTVFYTADFSLRSYHDAGFGVPVAWDIPLLGGYRHVFLPRWIDASTITFLRPLSRALFRHLRQGGFDVLWIHGYATLNSWVAMAAAKVLGIPVLLRTDSTLIDHPRGKVRLALKQAFFRLLRPFVYGVLSVGTRNTEYWRHYLGPDIPLFAIPYAVDNDFFASRCQQAAPHREQLRNALNLKIGRPVVLFASKLLSRKRCLDLVEAWLQLRLRSSAVQPYLLIIGEGEERTAIEKRLHAAPPAIAADARLLGFRNQSELPAFYDLADVFVLPSVHEPWGLVVNEVMNAARAVIVSDEAGCQPDLVVDGNNGCVYPARNISALAEALERVLADPAGNRAMGQRSFERIQAYSFDADVAGLMQAFHAAAAHRRRPRKQVA
jgi:glycosyltransferase involved in cell wall biosynthesis